MSARAASRARPAAGAGRRPATRVRPPARTRKPGLGARIGAGIGRAVAALPIPRDLLRRLRNWTLGLLVFAGVIAGLVAMGVPQMIGLAIAHAAGRMGMVVRTIQIEGREHVDRGAIYAVAMDARGQDMPLVDLAGLRAKLMTIPWVADARVSRRLPDTLVVDIVERAPVAIWQYQQRLALIDASGQTIAPLDPRQTAPDQLPVVIGRDANVQVGALAKLLDAQPVLKRLVQDATWVGGRRWDLHFQSGETLSLPEGDDEARAALASFARADSERRLLGKGIVRFDMRDPKRIVVRVTSQPGFRLDKLDPAAPALDEPAAVPAAGPSSSDPETPASQTGDTLQPQPIAQEKVL